MGGLDTARVNDSGATTTGQSPDVRTRLALEGQQRRAVQRTEATGQAFDPIAAAGNVHAMSENIFHMKDAAEQSLPQGWKAAQPNYDATIAQAKTNQQLDIPTALKAVDQLLTTTTDEATKKTLLQEKLDLETLEKAPGFTLAVKGLAEKRLGLDADADRDLAQAKALWSQLQPPLNMEDDPNFQRHLANCVRDEAVLKGQAPGANGPPSDTSSTGTTRTETVKPVDDATITRLNLPNDWNRESGVQQVSYLLSQTKPLDADMKALYEGAIAKAGSGPSPAIPALKQEIATRADHIDRAELAAHPDFEAQQTKLNQDLKTQIAALPAEKQGPAQLAVNTYLNIASSKKDQDSLRTAIASLDPTIGPKINQVLDGVDTLLQPVQAETFALNQSTVKLSSEQNQLAVTRAAYAQALFASGDQQNAQVQIVKAIGDNTSQAQAVGLKNMAVKFGVPSDQVAKMPDVATTAGPAVTSTSDSLPAVADAIAKAQDGFAGETGDKAAALAKHQADFEAATKLADNYMTTHAPQLIAASADATARIQAAMTPAEILKLHETSTKLAAEVTRVQTAAPADFALYNKVNDQATTDADRQTALAQLTKTQPNLVQLNSDFTTLWNKAPEALATQMQAVTLLQGISSARFVAHENYASALAAAGKPDVATAQMREAFKDLPPNFRQAYSQDPKLKPLLTSLNFDVNTVPAPELPFFAKAAQSLPAQAPTTDNLRSTRTDSTAGATTTADNSDQAIAQKFQQANADRDRLLQLEASAQATLKQKGLEAAKPIFDQAVQLADKLAGDPTENKARLAKGIAILSDKTHPVDPEQEKTILAILTQSITVQQNAADLHRQYAEACGSAYQWKDQQNQYAEADRRFDAIDNKLVGQYINIVGAESQRKDIDPTLAARYTSDLQTLKAGQELQIQTRQQEAAFYLLGGRTQTGTPINWDSHLQQAVIKGDPPLKPELARAALVKLGELDKEIHGNQAGSVDFTAGYDMLVNTYNANAPASLKLDIQDVKSQWQKPLSQILAGGAGLAATFILAAVSEGRTARIAAAGDDAALASIRSAETLGFVTRAADYFAGSSKIAKIASVALTPAGRIVAGAGVSGTVNSLEQYYGLQNHEPGSPATSFVEGVGAYTSAMALLGAKNYMGQVLFKGVTEEAVGARAIRILETEGGATKEALAKRFKDAGYAVPTELAGTGPLEADVAARVMGGGQRGNVLISKLFKREMASGIGALPDEAVKAGNSYNPFTSDLARRNLAQNYSALTAFSLVNTMTQSASEGISIHATGQQNDPRSMADPWVSWNPFRPLQNPDGTPSTSFTGYALQAMTSPLIGNLFFAELGALPAAAPVNEKLGQTFSQTRQEALALKAATTAGDSQNIVSRLWAQSTRVRPVVAEVRNQVTRAGSYVNPRGAWSDLSLGEKIRQANYLPILANGGVLQIVPPLQAAVSFGPIGSMRAEWERELARQGEDIQNDAPPALPVVPQNQHADVVAPVKPKPAGTTAVVTTPSDNNNGL